MFATRDTFFDDDTDQVGGVEPEQQELENAVIMPMPMPQGGTDAPTATQRDGHTEGRPHSHLHAQRDGHTGAATQGGTATQRGAATATESPAHTQRDTHDAT